MKVLVTGADGFLGSNIVRELLNRNFEVRGFLQEGRTAHTIKQLSIEITFGDILNASEVEHAAQGCDYIIHTAANTDDTPFVRTGLVDY
jgi:dihydroflavonol-4-reductase